MTDIAAIEARHRRAPAPWESWHGHCITCDPPWPCDTRQVLDALRAAEAREAKLRHHIVQADIYLANGNELAAHDELDAALRDEPEAER